MADLDELDAQVRTTNPELWRTKQVSDFLAGIWAQAYGRIYQTGIVWLLRIQRLSQILLMVMCIALTYWFWRARPRPSRGTPGDRGWDGAQPSKDTFAPPSPPATIDPCPEPKLPPAL
jgi:hypothetical protein